MAAVAMKRTAGEMHHVCVCVVSGREERRRGKNFLSFQVEQRRVPKKKKKRGPAITLTHARTDITRPSLYAPDLFISKDARVCVCVLRRREVERMKPRRKDRPSWRRRRRRRCATCSCVEISMERRTTSLPAAKMERDKRCTYHRGPHFMFFLPFSPASFIRK